MTQDDKRCLIEVVEERELIKLQIGLQSYWVYQEPASIITKVVNAKDNLHRN